MKHEMILFSADLKSVLARLSRKFNAGLVQEQEQRIRTPQEGVEVSHPAPQESAMTEA